MINQGARLNAGHFFLTAMFLLFLGSFNGCGSDNATGNQARTLPETGAVTMVILFSESGSLDSMPEAAADLPSTASGYFYPSDSVEIGLFRSLAIEADSTGKLLMCILPEGEHFAGSRDHLIINTDSSGIPVSVEPGLNSDLLSDSLWRNPVVRQQTILQLVHFFKPDMIFQIASETESSLMITEFWSVHGIANDISVALYAYPVTEIRYRGWGAFTGKGIRNGLLEGMDMKGFAATVRMISGMDWCSPDQGYPAMQAFYAAENE